MASPGKVSIYCGAPPENITERRLLSHLVRELIRLDAEAVILANFFVGPSSTQIDLVVATNAVACLTEVKGFRYPVEGGLNGQWVQRIGDTEIRTLGSKNPYVQTLEARFAVVDALAAFCGGTSEQFRATIKGVACLYPSPMYGSKIPKGNYKATIGGFNELLRLCTTPIKNAVSLVTWRAFARHLDLSAFTEPDRAGAKGNGVARSYSHALASVYGTHAIPFIDPPVSGLPAGSETLSCLADHLARGEQFQIVGASGTGKTLLLERLLLRAVSDNTVPIFIEARHFEGNMGLALRNAVSLATSRPLSELLRSVRLRGYPLVIFVDGLNECDPANRNRLLRALVAIRLRYGAQVVLTTQTETPLPPALTGVTIRMIEPDTPHFRRIVEANLKRELLASEVEALGAISTAQDAVVLANTLGNVRARDGRYALYSTYTRQKVAADERLYGALAELAFFMRERFLYTLDLQSALRLIATHGASATTLGDFGSQAIASGLLIKQGNRVRFPHDLIADFFASEHVLRRASDTDKLAIEFARPVNAGLREFLVSGSPSAKEIDRLLKAAPSEELLESVLRGRCGEMARRFLLDRLHDLIEHMADYFGAARLEIVTDEKKPGKLWAIRFADESTFDTPDDSLYLRVIPAGIREGLLPALLNALRIIDCHIAEEIARLRRDHPSIKGAWTDLAYRTVFGLPGGFGTQHLYRMLTSFTNIPVRRGGEPEVLKPIATALSRADEHKPGQLLFLLAAFTSFAPLDAPPPSQFPHMVETLWNQRIGHLRLMSLDAARNWGRNLPSDDRAALGDLLHSWLSDSDLWTNSIIFDALKEIGELRHGVTLESIIQEYRSLLSEPRTDLTADLAMNLYVSTFDHPLSELYYEAYREHLTADERQQISVLALQSRRESMTTAWLVSDLIDEPTLLAVPCLQPLAQAPKKNAISDQDSVSLFSSSVAVLAVLGAPLLPYEAAPSSEESAWRLAARLLYVLNRTKFGHKEQAHEIPPLWARFEHVGSSAALDVVVRLHDLYVDSRVGIRSTLLEHCSTGICRLCRNALSRDYIGTTHLRERRFSDDLEHTHRTFALEFLGNNGRLTDLHVIRAWVEDSRYGHKAHVAAKMIETRYSPVAGSSP